jgi:hypothetical protein
LKRLWKVMKYYKKAKAMGIHSFSFFYSSPHQILIAVAKIKPARIH